MSKSLNFTKPILLTTIFLPGFAVATQAQEMAKELMNDAQQVCAFGCSDALGGVADYPENERLLHALTEMLAHNPAGFAQLLCAIDNETDDKHTKAYCFSLLSHYMGSSMMDLASRPGSNVERLKNQKKEVMTKLHHWFDTKDTLRT